MVRHNDPAARQDYHDLTHVCVCPMCVHVWTHGEVEQTHVGPGAQGDTHIQTERHTERDRGEEAQRETETRTQAQNKKGTEMGRETETKGKLGGKKARLKGRGRGTVTGAQPPKPEHSHRETQRDTENEIENRREQDRDTGKPRKPGTESNRVA